jgi:hypothetical protein
MHFTATVHLSGARATYIQVPADLVVALDAGRHPKVAVTIGTYTFITTISSSDDAFSIVLSPEHRKAAGLEAGDTVDVALELDEAPQHQTLDTDFAAALAADETARHCFENLSYSKQHWFTSGIAEATKPEIKARRIESYVSMLREGKTP